MIAYASSHTAAAQSLVARIEDVILFPLIALLMGVALLVFLWGAFEMIYHSENETAREKGRQHLIFGIIGLVIMVSAYAILKIAANTFFVPIPGA